VDILQVVQVSEKWGAQVHLFHHQVVKIEFKPVEAAEFTYHLRKHLCRQET